MKSTYQKSLCLTLIVTLTLSGCDNQIGGSGGKAPRSRNTVLNLKDNVGLTDTDYRQDIFELNDVAVFDESGIKPGIFYIDSTKGIQLLGSAIIPKDGLNDNTKFLEFMKANKDKFTAIAASYPKPDNSLAMYYDKSHNTIHWLALNDAKTKWQEYSMDVTKSPQLISLLQESVIDQNVSRDNLAVSFRSSEVDGETMVDVTYAESNIASDLDGQPVAGAMRVSYLAKINNTVNNKSLILENGGAKFVEARGYLENTYIYSDSTSKAEDNFIRTLYPNAKVGKLTEHKVTFFDVFKLSLPALAIILASSVVGGTIGLIKRWKSSRRREEFKQEVKALEKDLSQIKNEQDAKRNNNNIQVNAELANKEKELIPGNSNPHSLALEKETPIPELEKVVKTPVNEPSEFSLEDGSLIMKILWVSDSEVGVSLSGRSDRKSMDIPLYVYSELKNVKTMKDVYDIMFKYKKEFGLFDDNDIFLFRQKRSKQIHLEVNVKTVYKNYADFINPTTGKRWPLLGAAIGSAASAGLLINDTYSQVADFIWGGCGNFTCSSAYFYGDKSESVVSIKADTLYQQVAFNDSKINYKLNVVQVFSQSCIEMIKNSAESNLTILYAKTGEGVGQKYYVISDVNNKLCPIGTMDMSKFIESIGSTQ
jgi:hypothetical protein